jgi:hypothetical protein
MVLQLSQSGMNQEITVENVDIPDAKKWVI